ncbi:MAG: type II toxin-antitoxin system HicA family toxin [Rhodospirillales bacterium]|jgi:hypothetical protein|nr:type II toxin-antitoxin system HicA family toxin [Rhodospirillales bacterium]
MGQIDTALRERLIRAGCYRIDADERENTEIWFSPHLNQRFTFSGPITTSFDANAILRAAGMEDAF